MTENQEQCQCCVLLGDDFMFSLVNNTWGDNQCIALIFTFKHLLGVSLFTNNGCCFSCLLSMS